MLAGVWWVQPQSYGYRPLSPCGIHSKRPWAGPGPATEPPPQGRDAVVVVLGDTLLDWA